MSKELCQILRVQSLYGPKQVFHAKRLAGGREFDRPQDVAVDRVPWIVLANPVVGLLDEGQHRGREIHRLVVGLWFELPPPDIGEFLDREV